MDGEWDEEESDITRKSSAGLLVSLCTCMICLLVVVMLMMAVLLLHDKEEAQGYDYPMYQVCSTDRRLSSYCIMLIGCVICTLMS